jgi:SAM-dependent methyltransferase
VNPNEALWEKGGFTAFAGLMRQSGADIVRPLGITAGMRMLDLGCGDGTTAVPAAEAGAEVVGIDIARNLVAAGNKRAADLGQSGLTFQERDACLLEGLADDSFDLSVSFFGAMFAPKPFDVAKEMVPVTKPGGRVVTGNWIPGDPTFVSQALKISSAFVPPPPEGFVSPMMWGVESHIIDRFGQAGIAPEKISMERDTFYFVSPDESPADVIELFRQFYGPILHETRQDYPLTLITAANTMLPQYRKSLAHAKVNSGKYNGWDFLIDRNRGICASAGWNDYRFCYRLLGGGYSRCCCRNNRQSHEYHAKSVRECHWPFQRSGAAARRI